MAMVEPKRWKRIALGVGLIALAGCAGTPPPRLEISAAEVAVREAEEANAVNHAPALLQQARDKLAFARQAVAEEDYIEARRLAEQAEVDAQLAEAHARAAVATANLRTVREGVDVLQDQEPPVQPATEPLGG